jgi:hypothetical protein
VAPRTGGPDRDTEDVGDLRRRQAGVVVERQDRALFWLELAEASLDLVAIRDRAEVIGCPAGVGVGGEQPDERPSAGPPRSRFAAAMLVRAINR